MVRIDVLNNKIIIDMDKYQEHKIQEILSLSDDLINNIFKDNYKLEYLFNKDKTQLKIKIKYNEEFLILTVYLDDINKENSFNGNVDFDFSGLKMKSLLHFENKTKKKKIDSTILKIVNNVIQEEILVQNKKIKRKNKKK